jgi:HEAT repeat protein
MTRTAAQRRRDAAVAGHAGDEAAARAMVDDAAPGVRATARRALQRMGALRAEDVEAALADPDANARVDACGLAIGPPGASVDIAGVLSDDEPQVVEAAAWALGERGDVDAVPALASVATTHDDALCREAAVAALGAIGDPSGLAAILTATTDKATVRRRAVLALAPFEGAEVDAALERATRDRDWQVRQAAEDLLTE